MGAPTLLHVYTSDDRSTPTAVKSFGPVVVLTPTSAAEVTHWINDHLADRSVSITLGPRNWSVFITDPPADLLAAILGPVVCP